GSAALSDERVEAMVRDDRIDILVDLTGYTDGGRLGLFARKPAPVQVAYLGYPNTTGLEKMDYRITDALADPPGKTEAFYTETLVRLPCAWCYRPPADAPAVQPLPMLQKSTVTLGSSSVLRKSSPGAVACWARILQ